MAQVLIRNLSNEVVERLKKRAAVRGRSLEQELREIVTAAAPLGREERVAIIDRHLARTKRQAKHNSTDFIRAARDAR